MFAKDVWCHDKHILVKNRSMRRHCERSEVRSFTFKSKIKNNPSVGSENNLYNQFWITNNYDGKPRLNMAEGNTLELGVVVQT